MPTQNVADESPGGIKLDPSKPYKRDKDDFVRTPAECTIAFLKKEGNRLPLRIWEPACGDGALAKLLPGEIVCSDLIDRGYGTPKIDFLMEREKWADAIIMNPPFYLNDKFIGHAFQLGISYIACFHPTIFMNTNMWKEIWRNRPPARVYILAWRPDIFNMGSPNQKCCYAWSVWDDRFERDPAHCIFDILERPK